MKQRTELIEVDGVWTLFHDGRFYAALLDARSRDDAETQIAEMRLIAMNPATGKENRNPCPIRATRPTASSTKPKPQSC